MSTHWLNELEKVADTAFDSLEHPQPKRVIRSIKKKFEEATRTSAKFKEVFQDLDEYDTSDISDIESFSPMSTPSIVDSDLAVRTKTKLSLSEQVTIAKELQKAANTDVSIPYRGFRTESPQYWDPRGTSPSFRKKGTRAEEDKRKKMMEEWKNRPERPVGPNRPVVKGFSTEDAMANEIIDKLDKEFMPTIQSPKTYPRLRECPSPLSEKSVSNTSERSYRGLGMRDVNVNWRKASLKKPTWKDCDESLPFA